MIQIKPQKQFGKCFKEIKQVYIQHTVNASVATVYGVLPCNRGVRLGLYPVKKAEKVVKQIGDRLSGGG